MYRRLNVYTAYEFLGRRFDEKTRLLGAGLFLLQRGLAAGVTIYAPAIIISTVLGWPLDLVIVFTGLLVIVYTVTGGSEAVALTHRWQVAVIWAGMVTAMIVLRLRLPDGLGFTGAAYVAGALGKLQAVDFSLDRGRARPRRHAEPVADPRVAPGPRVGRHRAGSERAGRHGRGQRSHRRDPRRGQGRPRGRRPARQDQGLRLRFHHVHPDAAAARTAGPPGGGDVRARAP